MFERAKFGNLQALDFFFARSGLRGPRACGKTGDEMVEAANFLFATGVFGLPCANGSARRSKIKHLAKSYDDLKVIQNFSANVTRGEKNRSPPVATAPARPPC